MFLTVYTKVMQVINCIREYSTNSTTEISVYYHDLCYSYDFVEEVVVYMICTVILYGI